MSQYIVYVKTTKAYRFFDEEESLEELAKEILEGQRHSPHNIEIENIYVRHVPTGTEHPLIHFMKGEENAG